MAVPPEQCDWLRALLAAKFFNACKLHQAARKSESNIFCMSCHVSLCQHCLPGHPEHTLLQVRRYVYHDVIRLHDVQKLVDCSGIQAYIINGARVVFLNERPQPRSTKSHNSCRTCERSLQDDFSFCSMGCKVAAATRRTRARSMTKSSLRRHQGKAPTLKPCAAGAGAAAGESKLAQGLHFGLASESHAKPRVNKNLQVLELDLKPETHCKCESSSSEQSCGIVPEKASSSEGSSNLSDGCPSACGDGGADEADSPHFLPHPSSSSGSNPKLRLDCISTATENSSAMQLPQLQLTQDSPVSVLPRLSVGAPPLSRDCMRSLLFQYEAVMACSPSTKRRKSTPHRSPAF